MTNSEICLGNWVALYTNLSDFVTMHRACTLFCANSLSCTRKSIPHADDDLGAGRENFNWYKPQSFILNSQSEIGVLGLSHCNLSNISDYCVLRSEFRVWFVSYFTLLALHDFTHLMGNSLEILEVHRLSLLFELPTGQWIEFVMFTISQLYSTFILIQKSGKYRLAPSKSVNLLASHPEVDRMVQISNLLQSNRTLDSEGSHSRLWDRPWIENWAKKSKKKSSAPKPVSNETKDPPPPPPPVEQKPEAPEPAPTTSNVDPRVVQQPVEPYRGLQLGSRAEGLRIIPGDIMITRRSRPPFDPAGASSHPMANPGGRCTLFVDHGYFERRRKDVYELEHMMDRCFDEGDMIVRFGSFSIYWLWSFLNPFECFEFQWETPPPSWFLFSRAQSKPLPPPLKTFNRRWMVVGRQQPELPDAQAIRPRLGDIIIRREEAMVWWQSDFRFQTEDLLIRAGYEREPDSELTLAAVEMYECSVHSVTEFMGRNSTEVISIIWTFLGRDMQYYGPGLIGQDQMRLQFNGPSGRSLSNRPSVNTLALD